MKHIKNFQLWGQYNGIDLSQEYLSRQRQGGGLVRDIQVGGAQRGDLPPPIQLREVEFSDKMLEPFVIDKEQNEFWLFHGTSSESVQKILQTNFREPVGEQVRHGGLYGSYCYFTNHLCKALELCLA